jgi:hypothetical protein
MTQRHCDVCSNLYDEPTLDLGDDELGFCIECSRHRQDECEELEREAADEKDLEIDRASRLVELELTAPGALKR